MPLHAEGEAVTGQLDRLDDVVVGPRGRLELRRQLVDGLVVVAGDGDGGAEQPVQHGAGAEGHPGLAEDAGGRAVPPVADGVGQVLVERAAERHVEQLRAPADAEHRQVGRQRAGEQAQFPVVAPPADDGLRVRALLVALRVDVRPAGQHQGVDASVASSAPCSCGGSSTGTPPARGHGVDVDVVQQRELGVPDPRAARSR